MMRATGSMSAPVWVPDDHLGYATTSCPTMQTCAWLEREAIRHQQGLEVQRVTTACQQESTPEIAMKR